MKLEEAKSSFYDATETLSENLRKLFFAGIAIVWILRVDEKSAGGVPFSRDALLALIAFTLGLVLDITQYTYKGTAWWLYYRRQHGRGVSDDAQVSPPAAINLPTFLLYYGKLVAGVYGYTCLLSQIWRVLRSGSPT